MLKNTTEGKTLQDLLKEPYEPLKRNISARGVSKYLDGGYKLSKIQRSILTGHLLGDGSLQIVRLKDETLNVKFKFDQKSSSKEYVYFVYTVFKDIVGTPPQLYKNRNGGESVWFKTYAIPAFRYYHDQWYTIDAMGQRHKTIPKLIHRHLDPDALAIWFMDDGSRSSPKRNQRFYTFSTAGFYHWELIRLQKALGNRYRLKASVWKDTKKRTKRTYYNIGILSESVDNLSDLIRAGVLPIFEYKLHPKKIDQ